MIPRLLTSQFSPQPGHFCRRLKCSLPLCILFFTSTLLGQGFYVKAGADYCWAIPSLTLGADQSYDSYSSSSSSYTVTQSRLVLGTFVRGPGGHIAIGVNSGSIAFEIELSAVAGSQFSTSNRISYVSNPNPPTINNTTHTYETSIWSIIPSVILTSEWGLYIKAGPVIAFPSITRQDQYEISGPGSSVKTNTFTGTPPFGAHGALGFALGHSNAKLYTQINFTILSWAPTKSTVTKYVVDGVDKLGTLNRSQREIDYDDSCYQDSRVPQSPDSPSRGLGTPVPMNSIGLQVGILIAF